MDTYRVIITSKGHGLYEWTYQADDAAHAMEQHVEAGMLDGTDIVPVYIEVRKAD